MTAAPLRLLAVSLLTVVLLSGCATTDPLSGTPQSTTPASQNPTQTGAASGLPLAAAQIDPLLAGNRSTVSGRLVLHNPTDSAMTAYNLLSTGPCGHDDVALFDRTGHRVAHKWDGLEFDCLAGPLNASFVQTVPASGSATIPFASDGWKGVTAGEWYLVRVQYNPAGAAAGSVPVSVAGGPLVVTIWVQAQPA